MRRILKRHEFSADEWRVLGEDAADADPLIVPLAELRKDTAAWLARSGRLGVRLAPAESVESLADVLPQLTLVAVEFPNVGDGRGFSYGRLLRDRLGFKGELRAVGDGVKPFTQPPRVIWYHSSPCLSTPRRPMCPTWWWPQAFMQPDILISMSPRS